MGFQTSKERFEAQVKILVELEREMGRDIKRADREAKKCQAEASVLIRNAKSRNLALENYVDELRSWLRQGKHARDRANKFTEMQQKISQEVTNLKLTMGLMTMQQAEGRAMVALNGFCRSIPSSVLKRVIHQAALNATERVMLQGLIEETTKEAGDSIIERDDTDETVGDEDLQTVRARVNTEVETFIEKVRAQEALELKERGEDLDALPDVKVEAKKNDALEEERKS